MADLSQTAANVKRGTATTPTRNVTYGETITQGQPLYLATDGKWYRCDANDGAAKAACGGIALTPGVADDGGTIAIPSSTPGQSLVNVGATLAVGMTYAISTTVGGIRPVTDAGSGEFVTTLGVATTTALLDFQVTVATVARAA